MDLLVRLLYSLELGFQTVSKYWELVYDKIQTTEASLVEIHECHLESIPIQNSGTRSGDLCRLQPGRV